MKILSFTFILLLLAANSFSAPQQKKKFKPTRTDQYIRMKGIRFGTDVTRPFQDLWTKGNRYGTEFSADMEIWPNLYPVFETGFETLKINSPHIEYSSNGSYSRIGIDYNLLQAENEKDKNLFFIGLRYGFAFAGQKISHYVIDSYWGQENGNFPNQTYSAHWGEILLGTKGEVFHNFYMGWTIRGKFKISSKALVMPPVYFIPGFGKADKGFNLDFTYSVYYNIPWDFRKSKSFKKPIVKPIVKPVVKKEAKAPTKQK